jgi:sulfite reductase beta subunit-like hemoprotein
MPIASTAGLVDNTKGVIPYLALEPEEFAVEAARYRAGEIDDTQFTPWRLRRGIYGQRQTDAQMVRVKLPGGLGTAEQLDALALIADELAPLKMGHITTRENIQYHHISLEDAPTVIRILGEAGLSTREACGNTVRNVIADPMMGVDPEQAFDITPSPLRTTSASPKRSSACSTPPTSFARTK